MVGGDDVPGGPLRAGGADGLFVGLHVVVPEAALGEVGGREFPVLPRIFEPLQEPLALLVLGDVEEELEDHRAVAGQVPLEGVDVFVAVGPEVVVDLDAGNALGLDQLGMDPDDQHFLVIRAVEDADPAALGQRPRVPPEEVVIELLGRGLLEAEDLAALGIDARHDVLDGAVLAGGVHRLEDDQDRPGIGGVEPILGLGQLGDVLGERFLGELLPLLLGELGIAGPVGIVVLEADLPVLRYPATGDEIVGRSHDQTPSERTNRPHAPWKLLARLPARPSVGERLPCLGRNTSRH